MTTYQYIEAFVFIVGLILNASVWYYYNRVEGGGVIGSFFDGILGCMGAFAVAAIIGWIVWFFYGYEKGLSFHESAWLAQDWGGIPIFLFITSVPIAYRMWGHRMWRRRH